MKIQLFLVFTLFFVINGRIERRCDSLDIRNTPSSAFMATGSKSNWKTFEACTFLDGDFTIAMINDPNVTDEDFKTFPYLRVITGSVVVFQVAGLTSLKTILPNLQVIGGQSLLMNYALAVYQNPHLKTIGLDNLKLIRNGGVRIKKNPELCYVESIDWPSILAGKVRDVVVENSGYTSEDDGFAHSRLTNVCLGKVGCKVSDETKCHKPNGTLSCWNATYCQQFCKYHKNPDNTLGPGCDPFGEKCHHLCVGGCDYPNDPNYCTACKYVDYEGTCLTSCPSDTFELFERRCITKDECTQRRPVQSSRKGSENMLWKAFKGKCHYDCPKGYQEDENDPKTCKKCEKHCPKKCRGGVIESIGEALQYSKCNIIEESLEIVIKIGEPVSPEKFTEAFGEIEEIMGYLVIRFSLPLTSLYMFKSLSIIHGRGELINNKYSLVVEENPNLRTLFNIEKQPLKILNGTVSFLNNKLLCKDKIDILLEHAGIDQTKASVSQYSNGDRAVCNEVPIKVEVIDVRSFSFTIKWEKFNTTNMDQRKFYGYEVFYKKVEKIDEKMSKEDDRLECSDSWKTKFIPYKNDVNGTTIEKIMSNSIYAYYIQTRVINHPGARSGSSEIQFITTRYDIPDPPKIKLVKSLSSTEIGIKWDISLNPKGDITHYQILWTAENDIDYSVIDNLEDPCTAIAHQTQLIKSAKEKLEKEKNDEGTCSTNKGCCKCSDIISADVPLIEAVSMDNELTTIKNNDKRHVETNSNLNLNSTIEETAKIIRKKRNSENYEFLYSIRIRNNMTKDGGYGSVNVTGLSAVITGLKHYTLYRIAVQACQNITAIENHCSPIKITAAVRTEPIPENDIVDVDSIKVYDIIGNNNTKRMDTRRIKWKPPKEPNSKLIAFKVSVWKGSDTPLEQCVRYSDFVTNDNSVIFNGLTTGNYNFAVHSLTLLGLSKATIRENFFEVYIPGFFTFQNILYIIIGTLLFIILAIFGGRKYYKENFGKKVRDAAQRLISANPEYIITTDFYKTDEWELKRDDLEIKDEIGSGTFGKVFKGYGKDIISFNGIKFGDCAIKMVTNTASHAEKIRFLLEASVMKEFDTSFIVKLLGIVSIDEPVLVVMELMQNANLRDYLRARRPDSEDNINHLPLPSILQYFKWSIQIADGMAYLEWKKFCHRDLAARNCMVTIDETVKIGDFGMARDIYYHNYYRPAGKRLMPVRWMAPESLKDGIFSVKSDVWSYGVVLYEMLTLGEQPYAGLGNDQVFTYIGMKRNVLLRPTGCPDFWYDLMRVCWKYDPKERPWFYQIVLHLESTIRRTPLKNPLMTLFDKQCFVTTKRIHDDQVEDEDYDFSYNEDEEYSKKNRMLQELEKLQAESATDYEYEALKRNKKNKETEGLDLINAEAKKFNTLTLEDMNDKIEVEGSFVPKYVKELEKLGRKQSDVNGTYSEINVPKKEPVKSRGSRRLPPEYATSDMDKMKESKQVHQRLKEDV